MRYGFFPIPANRLIFYNNHYLKQLKVFWTVEEISFIEDVSDWSEVPAVYRKVFGRIMKVFNPLDTLVEQNLRALGSFIEEDELEIKSYLPLQGAIETEHRRTYSIIPTIVVQNSIEREEIMNGHINSPVIQSIIEYTKAHTNLQTVCVANGTVEAIIFTPLFVPFFWLKGHDVNGKKVFPGMRQANELISRDENLHWQFITDLYKSDIVQTKLTDAEIHAVIRKLHVVMKQLVDYIFEEGIEDLNKENMLQYVEFISDRFLESMGHSTLFNATNPYSFMSMQGLMTKSNFNEKRVVQYTKVTESDVSFNNDLDF